MTATAETETTSAADGTANDAKREPKRYDRRMTDAVRATSLGMGMDLVGFGPTERWEHAPYLLSPQAILPEARTVIVSAIHITDTWTEMGGEPEPQDRSPGGWMDQNSLLDRVAYRLVRILTEDGYKAIGVASSNIWRYRQFEGIPSLFAPDLSHIHAATAAGLAEIGWSGLAITPEFGSRVRFISVVTDAPLVPTPMYDGPKLCDMCMECVRHCPTASLRKELGKPHEVVIGGKKFRYANKNIWRCAWAEHFDLDLNSENLKRSDHIGEKEILEEIEQNGTRGHERGVCQKVCVPPHLRTKEPSFGRARQIAQNRINRRYPESMPTLRKMRDDLFARAVHFGAEVCACGPLDEPVTTAPGFTTHTEFPGVRSALAFAMRVPGRDNLTADTRAAIGGNVHALMHHVLLRTARAVEDYGYHAASYTGPTTGSGEAFDELAVAAGLGVMTDDGRLSVHGLGTDAIVGAVTTDAPVDPSPAADAAPFRRRRAPSPRRLRDALEHVARDNLVTLFGVAPASRFDAALEDLRANVNEDELGEYVHDTNPRRRHGAYHPAIARDAARRLRRPDDHLSGAESVIILGMHFPGELIANAGLAESQQVGTYAFHQYQTRNELAYAAYELVRTLDRHGYRAQVSCNMLGIGGSVDSPRGLLPDARCNAIEAVAAGLGQIGNSGALLTPRYGAHQRCIAIVTDAPLPADAVYDGERLCTDCGRCRSECPMGALDGGSFDVRVDGAVVSYPKIRRHRCDWSKRYSLCAEEGPGLIGNNTNVAPPEGDLTIEDVAEGCRHKDPIMKTRTCVLETCLRRCGARRATD